VSPALPAGLVFTTGTGVISGTPTELTPSASYTVTGVNAAGSTQVTLVIQVVALVNADMLVPLSVHPGDAWMKASVLAPSGTTDLRRIATGTGTGAITSGQGTDLLGFGAGISAGTFQVQANVQDPAGDATTNARTVTVQKGTWLVENGGAAVPRMAHTATLLNDGTVLVAGGSDPNGTSLGSAEIYNPAAGTWAPTGGMNAVREYATALLLPSGGGVLMTFGLGGDEVTEIFQ
jgi:hypothetical protein